MRNHTGFFTAFVFLISIPLLNSCSNTGSSSSTIPSNISEKSKVLQIRMHDLPISGQEIEKVVVEIKEIQVHHAEKGWISVSTEPQSYNLLELQNGASAIIFQKPLEIGTYTQIRLILNQNNEIFVKGRPYRLLVPSGEETGVKLVTPFEIKEGKMVEVTLDFDVAQSVGLTKGQGFKLHPVIKVVSVAEYDGLGVVTSLGGNVSSLDNGLSLRVPSGATSGSILVSMDEVALSTLPDLNIANATFVGKVYNLDPDGYVFSKNVTLEFSYNEEEVSSKGAEENLKLLTYDEAAGKWVIVPSSVLSSANIVHASITHFSLYALAVVETCEDGIQNNGETGIDCGGSCPAQCVDCNDYDVLGGAAPSGTGPMAEVYSFGDEFVSKASVSAIAEYATSKSITDDSRIYTPDEKMEAVARYVHRHMAYMNDEGDTDWSGLLKLYIPLSAFSVGDFLPPPPPLPPPPGPLPPLPGAIILPSDLLSSNPSLDDTLRTTVDDLFNELKNNITYPPPSFNDFLDSKFQEFMCKLVNVSEADWDPLFKYFLQAVYDHIYAIYPDAKPQTAAYTVK